MDFIKELFKFDNFLFMLRFRILRLRIWDSGLRISDKFRGVPRLTTTEFEIQTNRRGGEGVSGQEL